MDELLALLNCPDCRGSLKRAGAGLSCAGCQRAFPLVDGRIPSLVHKDSAIKLDPADLLPVEDRGPLGSTDSSRQARYWENDTVHRDARHPIVQHFSQQRWEHLAKLVPLDQVKTALDVGCGNGFSSALAPAHIDVVGCDGAAAMLRRHPGDKLVQADVQWLPFADKSFDLVYCWELLHHVNEPWRALAEMRRISRRWVLFFEPNPLNAAQFLFSLADVEHRWVLRFSREYCLDQARRAGLHPTAFQRVGCIFPNRTPDWLHPVLKKVPFRIPVVGISQLVVCEVEGARA